MDHSTTQDEITLIGKAAKFYSETSRQRVERATERRDAALIEAGLIKNKNLLEQTPLYIKAPWFLKSNFIGALNNYMRRHEIDLDAEDRADKSRIMNKHGLNSNVLEKAFRLAKQLKPALDEVGIKSGEQVQLDHDIIIVLKCHPSMNRPRLCKECSRMFPPAIHNQLCCSPKCSQKHEEKRHWIANGKLNREILVIS